MKCHLPRYSIKSRQGWSLIELIFVIGLLAVLTTALAPALIKQLSRNFHESEKEKIQVISYGFKEFASRLHQIPGPTNVVGTINQEIGWTADQLLNNAWNSRRILYDASFKVGAEAGSNPPYVQGVAGSIEPEFARIILLSATNHQLPDGIQNGFLDHAEFEAIWNTESDEIPNGWDWDGSPEDLVIHRIHFQDLFVRVILNNTGAGIGRYSIDESQDVSVPGSSASFFFMKGSRLGLHDSDSQLQVKVIVEDSVSYAFTDNMWRKLGGTSWEAGNQFGGCDLLQVVEHFTNAPKHPDSSYEPEDLRDAMAILMDTYLAYEDSNWAEAEQIAYQEATDDIADITDSFLNGDDDVEDDGDEQSQSASQSQSQSASQSQSESGGNGNNGVGNGEDPQPPGNPPINDGPGAGPGNPGNQGGANGNNGVGNGEDPQPPGNPPMNDGPGAGPGNPGNQGGANGN